MNKNANVILAICVFSVAMAALESSVVVYLRALYYPEGFTVAFKLIDESILGIELLRELATLIMLGSIGYLSGTTLHRRIAYFLLAFAVWDIFYYGWLKIMINWPASLSEWDILFLIPFTWLGPVWAPLVCSLTMIILAFVLLSRDTPIPKVVWMFLILGSCLILYSFMQDYGKLIVVNGFLKDYPALLSNRRFLELASDFVPERFNVLSFWLGEALLFAGIYVQYRGLSGFDLFGRASSAVSNKSAG